MKNSKSVLATLLILAATVISVPAQQATSDYKTFGAGVSFQPFGIANILEEFEGVPITKFNLALNVTKGFRAEIDLGYYSRNSKSENTKSKAYDIGFGFLGTRRIAANVIMGGVKCNYTAGKFAYEDMYSEDIEDTFKRFAVGPVLAYEHLFGNQVGIGGELGLKYSSYQETPGDSDAEKYKSTSIYCDSAIFMRVYF